MLSFWLCFLYKMFTIRLYIFVVYYDYLNSHITNIKSWSLTIRSRLTVFVLNVFIADLNFISKCAPKRAAYTHDDILQCPFENIGPKTLGVGVHYTFKIFEIWWR